MPLLQPERTETASTPDALLALVLDAIDSAYSEAEDEPATSLSVAMQAEEARQHFLNATNLLVRRYERGELVRSELVDQIEDRFSKFAIRSFLAGKRSQGPFGLTADDRAAIQSELRREYDRLQFVPSDKWNTRLRLYASRMNSFAQLGMLRAFLTGRVDKRLVWWVVGTAEHCDDCLKLADNGPYQATEVIGTDVFPGSGHTRCGSNCKCSLMFADSLQRPRKFSTKTLKGYRTREFVL